MATYKLLPPMIRAESEQISNVLYMDKQTVNIYKESALKIFHAANGLWSGLLHTYYDPFYYLLCCQLRLWIKRKK